MSTVRMLYTQVLRARALTQRICLLSFSRMGSEAAVRSSSPLRVHTC